MRTMLHAGIALAIAVTTAAPGSAQSVLLRYRPEAGTSHRVMQEVRSEVSQTMMGQVQEVRQTMRTGMLFEVLSKEPDGSARVRWTYESTAFEMDGPMGRMTYDSSNPQEAPSPTTKPYSVMVGESLSMTVAPDGSVRDLEGTDRLMDRMLEAVAAPDGPMREQMESAMRRQFGDEAMTATMQNMMGMFPDGPVAVGDSWSHTLSAIFGFPMNLETTWTLREVQGGVARMDVRSVTTPGDDPVVDLGVMRARYEVSGETTGWIEVEVATGWPLRSRMEGEMAGTMTMEGTPSGDVSIPMTVKSVTSTETLPGR